MTVLSLRDYAEQKNISYEAVRKQVARYKDDLAGHIIMDGRQQFLDEEAVAFLDAKRQKNPVAIIQQSKDEAIEDLRQEREQLLHKIAAQAEQISKLAQWKADNAMLIAGAEQSRLALEAAEKETKLLEGFIQDAKAEIAVLSDERDRAKDLARANEEAAQRTRLELTAAQGELRTASAEAWHHYRIALEIYDDLPWWKKRRRNKPVPPELQEDSYE